MAQNPIGTITDEERLVPLHTREDAFFVDVTEPVRIGDVPEEGTFAWRLREESDVPRLAFAPVDDAEAAGDLPTRPLSTSEEAITLDVPEALLVEGLDLDVAAYDDDNPLLFVPDEITDGIAVGMTSEGESGESVRRAIELRPIRYADGTPYLDEPARDSSMDSDPIAQAEVARDSGDDEATTRPETMSAPLAAAVVEDVLGSTDASRADVVDSLETIARQGLVSDADDESGSGPLAVGDRILVSLNEDTWTDDVVPQLDVDDSVVEAVREIHVRQADDLVQSEGNRDRFDDHVQIVVDANSGE